MDGIILPFLLAFFLLFCGRRVRRLVRALLLAISLLLWFYYAPFFIYFYSVSFSLTARKLGTAACQQGNKESTASFLGMVAISSVDEDILASCNVVVVVVLATVK
jgi:phosphoglycerol transferase MdoB-like AlkP superfamily enzyme